MGQGMDVAHSTFWSNFYEKIQYEEELIEIIELLAIDVPGLPV